MDLRKITRISIMLSLAIVLSIVESMIPIFAGSIPGLKIGLANVAIMVVLYVYGFKEAIFVSISRIFIVSILRTGLFNITFFFSLSGAIFSLVFMFLFKKIKVFSIIGVSIIGSIFHTIGQIIVALIFVQNLNILYYLPIILVFSIFTGLLTGYISKQIIMNFDKNIDRNTKM